MYKRARLGPQVLGLIAFSLAAFQPIALATSPPVGPIASRPATDPDAPIHQRLIIKLKDADASLAAPLRIRNAQLAIAGLGNRIGPAAVGLGSVPLSLHRSIRPGLHVATTGQGVKRARLQQLIRQLSQDPSVEYAEIDERIYPQLTPNDPEFTHQWNLWSPGPGTVGGANLAGAWNTANGQGVVVAVIDTGIRPHRDLSANILPGYDFVSDPMMANDGNGWDADPSDPGDWVSWLDTQEAEFAGCAEAPSSWHGTSMAGTIAAVSNNGIDIAGIAPAARILPVRVFGKCGGYVSDVIAGLYWSVGILPDAPAGSISPPSPPFRPAQVVNLSMGADGSCSRSFQDAIDQARARGAVVVAAAGNRAGDSTALSQPANCEGVIAVTAHTRAGDLADYSNRGTGTALSAPGGGSGVNLPGADSLIALSNRGDTLPGPDDLGFMAGTSIAAAHVSGVAALLLGRQASWSPDQVWLALSSSARAYPSSSYCHDRETCGVGMLDAAAALDWQQSNPNPYVAPEPSSSGGGGGGTANWPELLLLLSAALLTRFRRSPLPTGKLHESGSAQATRESGRM